MIILTLNSGSSSVKYSLFNTKTRTMLVNGIVDRVGQDKAVIYHEKGKIKVVHDVECADYNKAINIILKMIVSPTDGVLKDLTEIKAIGHRVVHGGEKFIESSIIDDEIEREIEELFPLAPLHNPPNLEGIRAAKGILKDIPHIAIFDTTFHQTMPPHAYRYAIPAKWYYKYKVRRYGFHGTSHRFVANRAIDLLDKCGKKSKIITLHLGNGCSITAIKDGKSIDTSMGMTPLEGLIMGTRSGDLDPAVPFFMTRTENLTTDEVDNLLNRQSGLLGITEGKRDMRDIEKLANEGDTSANLALSMATYRVRKYIGSYYVALGGLDALVFTAGIGENSSTFREMVLRDCEFLGIKMDPEANSKARGGEQEIEITTKDSKIKVFVIPTNEELAMAQIVEYIVGKHANSY